VYGNGLSKKNDEMASAKETALMGRPDAMPLTKQRIEGSQGEVIDEKENQE